MTEARARAWLDAYRTAWITRNPDLIVSLFAETGIYRESPYDSAPLQGHAEIREYWTRVTRFQDDVSLRFGRPVVVGSRIAVEWWVTHRRKGIPSTTSGGFFLQFDESGLCTDLREYWMRNDGTYVPPADWGYAGATEEIDTPEVSPVS
jgi:hypothetical protein